MADFFDTSSLADIRILHKSVRQSVELDNVIDSVEWEILNAFSQRDMEAIGTYEAFFEYESGRNPNDEIKVRLVGYDSATPTNSIAGLKEAMKRTIAEVASWVLRNYDTNNDVQSIQQGKRSITYSGQAPTYDQFPSGWDRRLKNYDARITPYGI